jgi:hypothetical protein
MPAENRHLYLDTTVFVNCGQIGALLALVRFVGDDARIVDEVAGELRRGSTREDLRFLGALEMVRGWPPAPPARLTPEQMAEVLDIKRAIQRPGDHALKDLGEIASVVAAKADGGAPVASDDHTAAMLCSVRGLRRVSSADLIGQMRSAGLID